MILTIFIEIYLLFLFIRMSNDIHFVKEFIENKFNYKDTTNRVFKNDYIESEKDTSYKDGANEVKEYETIPINSPYLSAFKLETYTVFKRAITFDEFKEKVSPIVEKFNKDAQSSGYNYNFNSILSLVWNDFNKNGKSSLI